MLAFKERGLNGDTLMWTEQLSGKKVLLRVVHSSGKGGSPPPSSSKNGINHLLGHCKQSRNKQWIYILVLVLILAAEEVL